MNWESRGKNRSKRNFHDEVPHRWQICSMHARVMWNFHDEVPRRSLVNLFDTCFALRCVAWCCVCCCCSHFTYNSGCTSNLHLRLGGFIHSFIYFMHSIHTVHPFCTSCRYNFCMAGMARYDTIPRGTVRSLKFIFSRGVLFCILWSIHRSIRSSLHWIVLHWIESNRINFASAHAALVRTSSNRSDPIWSTSNPIVAYN